MTDVLSLRSEGIDVVPLGTSKFSAVLMALMAMAVSEVTLSQMAAPAVAGPVVCTTTLEAPDASDGFGFPVEVTTCATTETSAELVHRRFDTWTAPFGRGVDLTHQITDMLGIAVAGDSGNQLMGFGFPDQTIGWDAIAIENTVEAMIEEQSPPLVWRTRDLSNGFGSSLSMEQGNPPAQEEIPLVTPLW
jgi:hypothetical protein